MYSIKLEKRVVKYIDTCPLKHQAQLKAKVYSLKDNPYPNDYKHIKGFPPYLRVDLGEYRIIYKVENTMIFIVLVGKRNDDEVYKSFKRLT